MKNKDIPIALAITGASGSIYALRLLDVLLQSGETVYLIISKAAFIVLAMEEDLILGDHPKEIHKRLVEKFTCRPEQLYVFAEQDWLAPIASGSAKIKGMAIVPCTTGTLGAIASGISNCLINRAADVCLKEKNKLILLVRETPFSTIHLENMLKLSKAGAIIMPANPGFYNNPNKIMDIVDYMVARVLKQFCIEQNLFPQWGKD